MKFDSALVGVKPQSILVLYTRKTYVPLASVFSIETSLTFSCIRSTSKVRTQTQISRSFQDVLIFFTPRTWDLKGFYSQEAITVRVLSIDEPFIETSGWWRIGVFRDRTRPHHLSIQIENHLACHGMNSRFGGNSQWNFQMIFDR